MENKQEARKHHYIPQFILKNFKNNDGQVMYYDIANNKLEARNTKKIFMNIDMYRDEVNHIDDPTHIENSLAQFECEISEIINRKILDINEIILNRRELEKLRIFLGLLSFRCDYRAEQYKNNEFDEATRKVLLEYAKDGNFEDLWKREMDELSKIRTYEEFNKSEVIDPIIKMNFEQLLSGYYMTIVDARGGEFLITDVYPTLAICPLVTGTNIHLHYFYPVSPNRMIVLNHIMFRKEGEYQLNNDPLIGPMKKLSEFRGNLLKQPKHIMAHIGELSYDDKYVYKPQKIYARDLTYINALFLNEARIGIIFSNINNIKESIKKFNEMDNTKQKFIELEKKIEAML